MCLLFFLKTYWLALVSQLFFLEMVGLPFPDGRWDDENIKGIAQLQSRSAISTKSKWGTRLKSVIYDQTL